MEKFSRLRRAGATRKIVNAPPGAENVPIDPTHRELLKYEVPARLSFSSTPKCPSQVNTLKFHEILEKMRKKNESHPTQRFICSVRRIVEKRCVLGGGTGFVRTAYEPRQMSGGARLPGSPGPGAAGGTWARPVWLRPRRGFSARVNLKKLAMTLGS